MKAWNRQHQFRMVALVASSVVVVAALEIVWRVLGHDPISSLSPIESDFCLAIAMDDIREVRFFETNQDGIFAGIPDADWDSWWIDGVVVNAEGFRGAEFAPSTGPPSILFLGDSFTWGATARPIGNSFVDRVQEAGFLTFNTGIGGTDTSQYRRVAEKYVPRLRPDHVIVALYMGNDVNRAVQPAVPNVTLHYQLEGPLGWIYAYDHRGEHLSTLTEAVDYYRKSRCRIYESESSITRLAERSAVLSTFALHFEPGQRSDPNTEVRANLLAIREIALANGARFSLFLIPVRPDIRSEQNSIEANLPIFRGMSPEFAARDYFVESDYHEGRNNHFNNSGHAKFAQLILSRIQAKSRQHEW